MPAYYDYRCTACGKVESRYRNARRSRCCRADLVRVDPLADLDPHRRELATFLQGKKIAGLRFDAEPGPGAFDLILSDGSELELYVISGRLTWVLMTAEEVAEQQVRDAEQDARDIRELDAQLADLRSGKAPLYEHDEVWAEIDAEVVRDSDIFRLAQRAAAESGFLTFDELVAAVEKARGESLDLPPMARE